MTDRQVRSLSLNIMRACFALAFLATPAYIMIVIAGFVDLSNAGRVFRPLPYLLMLSCYGVMRLLENLLRTTQRFAPSDRA